MYGNFIYLILALLIYTTYYPPREPYLGSFETLVLFWALLAVFVFVTRASFQALLRKMDRRGPYGLQGRFDQLINRQAMLAVLVFSIDVHILNLKLFVMTIPLFSASPTLTALLFISLFLAYLAILWSIAHKPYVRLFGTQVSRQSYVLSNLLFLIPVILPWLLITAGMDIINALPYEAPKHFLATPEGEIMFFSCFLACLIVVAPSLVKTFWRCRPLPSGPKRDRIDAMCRRAKLGYNNVLKWPIFEGRLMTAGVMGLIERFRYILVTDSLLQILNDEEIDAVMAHEIGHVKKKHLVLYLIFFLGFIVLSYAVFDVVLYGIIYTNLMFPIISNPGAESFPVTSVLFTIALAATLFVYFRYLFGYFMRNCERQADLYAFSLLGSSQGLVSSLEKIALYSGQSPDRPSWHHFSIRQRIDYLKKCEEDRHWIARHDRKLHSSLALFVVGLVSVGYVGYAINFGEMGKNLNEGVLERLLARELKENPKNPMAYSMLGSIYYQNEAYADAIEAYEKAVDLAPHQPEVLNNLAWLYATAQDVQYRDPVKALVYAKQAALLSTEPHILDTLAESYYVNGLHQEAIQAIQGALAMGPKDRAYYEAQLMKFEEAAMEKGGG